MTQYKRDMRAIRSLVIKIVAIAACIIFASVLPNVYGGDGTILEIAPN